MARVPYVDLGLLPTKFKVVPPRSPNSRVDPVRCHACCEIIEVWFESPTESELIETFLANSTVDVARRAYALRLHLQDSANCRIAETHSF